MKLNVLISYAYWENSVINFVNKHRDDLNILLDSGAFTFWKKNGQMQLDHGEYLKFLTDHRDDYDEAIQLDVIGDPAATKLNYYKERDLGFETLPVFTKGHTSAYLDEIGDRRFAIGALTGHNSDQLVDDILSRAPGAEKAHLLGADRLKYFNHRRPPQSMDASNWVSGLRFGQVPLMMETGRTLQFGREVFENPRHKDYLKAKMWMQKYGMEIQECRNPEEWRNKKDHLTVLRKLTAYSALERIKFIKKRFNKDLYLVVSIGSPHHELLGMIIDEIRDL